MSYRPDDLGSTGATGGRAILAAAVLACAAAQAQAHPHVWIAHEAKAVFENGALTGLRYRWVFDEMYTASATEGLDRNKDGRLDAAELDELMKVNIEGLKEFDYFTAATLAGAPVPLGDAKDFALEVVAVDAAPGPQMLIGPEAAAGTQKQPPAIVLDGSQREAPRTVWGRISGWFSGLFGRSPTPAAAAGNAAAGATQGPAAGKPAEKPKVLALQFTLTFKQPLQTQALVAGDKGFQFNVGDPQGYIWFEPAGAGAISLAPGAPADCSMAEVELHMNDEQRRLAEAFAKVGGAVAAATPKANGIVCARP